MSESVKEQKLAAARSKLQQYRSRKCRANDGGVVITSSNVGSQASTNMSSRASSCDPLNGHPDYHEVESSPADAASATPDRSPLKQQLVQNTTVDSHLNQSVEISNSVTQGSANAVYNPSLKSAASLFHTSSLFSENGVSSFFADSMKYATTDVSSPQDSTKLTRDVSSVGHVEQNSTISQYHNTSNNKVDMNIQSNLFILNNEETSSKIEYSCNNNVSAVGEVENQSTNFKRTANPLSYGNMSSINGSGDAATHIAVLEANDAATSSLKGLASNSVANDNTVSDNCGTTDSGVTAGSPVHGSSTDSVMSGTSQSPASHFVSSRSGEPGEQDSIATSSVGSLHQISRQLQGLAHEAAINSDSNNVDGEVCASSSEESTTLRSYQQSLELKLHEQQLVNTQQQEQLQELLQERCSSNSICSASGAAAASVDANKCLMEEIVQVRQQLQTHVQTVTILVAEKTQLQAQVSELQHRLRSSAEQSLDAEARLEAVRRRVEEAEATVRRKEADLMVLEAEGRRLSGLLQGAHEERDRYKLRCTDHELRAAELAERVSSSGKDQQSLQEQLTETKTQLHMANIRIEQLRNSSGDSANILDELNCERRGHEAAKEQLAELEQQLVQAQHQQTQLAHQYQQYTAQLVQQSEQFRAQAAESQQQTQQLESSLQRNQQQLQDVQQQLQQHEQESSGAPTLQQQLEEAQLQVPQLTSELQQVKELLQQARDTNTQLERDNLSLSQLSQELQGQVERLEVSIDRRDTQAVDSTQLMARLQSDKVAAARALAQNKQLKEQLAELQDGFVMMSNKKLEVTEKLERELHIKKSLHKQVAGITEEAARLREAGVVREREVQQLRESCSSLASQLSNIKQRQRESEQKQEQHLQQQQRGELLQVAQQQEEHLHLLAEVQQEHLEQVSVDQKQVLQQMVHEQKLLEKDMSQRREQYDQQQRPASPTKQLKQQQQQIVTSVDACEEVTSADQREGTPGTSLADTDAGVVTSPDTPHLLADQSLTTHHHHQDGARPGGDGESKQYSEVSLVRADPGKSYAYILEHMREGDLESTSMVEVLARLNREGAPAGRCALLEYRLAQLSSTHSALVSRFRRAMEQVAQLQEEKQLLEVTMEQLQLENETIGDYITLYQFRRGVLSQQIRDKDLELDRLRGDRQTLLEKLTRLQELIVRLAEERGEASLGSDGAGLLSGAKSLLIGGSHHTAALATGAVDGTSTCNGSVAVLDTPAAASTVPEAAAHPSACEELSSAGTFSNAVSTSASSAPTSPTVQRILALIKDMEATPCSDARPLHPCSLCSGSLVTV